MEAWQEESIYWKLKTIQNPNWRPIVEKGSLAWRDQTRSSWPWHNMRPWVETSNYSTPAWWWKHVVGMLFINRDWENSQSWGHDSCHCCFLILFTWPNKLFLDLLLCVPTIFQWSSMIISFFHLFFNTTQFSIRAPYPMLCLCGHINQTWQSTWHETI